MKHRMKLAGASGREYAFMQVDETAPWARNAGVVVFAAPDTYGWRVISVIEVTGRLHDIRPFWAQREAERYGARAVFFASEPGRPERLETVRDLVSAFCPVAYRPAEADLSLAA